MVDNSFVLNPKLSLALAKASLRISGSFAGLFTTYRLFLIKSNKADISPKILQQ